MRHHHSRVLCQFSLVTIQNNHTITHTHNHTHTLTNRSVLHLDLIDSLGSDCFFRGVTDVRASHVRGTTRNANANRSAPGLSTCAVAFINCICLIMLHCLSAFSFLFSVGSHVDCLLCINYRALLLSWENACNLLSTLVSTP